MSLHSTLRLILPDAEIGRFGSWIRRNGEAMKRWVLSLAQRLADIRNTRLWTWIGPVYRGFAQVISLESCLPRALRGALGVGLHNLFSTYRSPGTGNYRRVRTLSCGASTASAASTTRRTLSSFTGSSATISFPGTVRVSPGTMWRGYSKTSQLTGCEKRWVLNRIVDPEEEAIIIRLLEAHGQPYLRIPFEWEAYAAQPWDLDGMPRPGFTLSEEFEDLRKDIRERAMFCRHKNNYAINNNGARKAALEDGRGRAKWVLPWDGNCFMSP